MARNTPDLPARFARPAPPSVKPALRDSHAPRLQARGAA
jgi:hypothetical protein